MGGHLDSGEPGVTPIFSHGFPVSVCGFLSIQQRVRVNPIWHLLTRVPGVLCVVSLNRGARSRLASSHTCFCFLCVCVLFAQSSRLPYQSGIFSHMFLFLYVFVQRSSLDGSLEATIKRVHQRASAELGAGLAPSYTCLWRSCVRVLFP